MRKIIKTLLVVMLIAMTVMTFAACKEEADPCANGHTMEAFGEDLPTCTQDGLSSGVVCTVCGYAERTRFPIPAKGHKMAEATCEAPSTCTVCGITEGEALGHDMAEVAALEPTCTKEGYNAHLGCTRCNYTEGKETIGINPDAHTLVDVEAKEPGCEDRPGYTAHKACACGYTEGKEVVTVEGHDFDENELFYYPSAPTCTEGTYIAGYCTSCGGGFLLEEVLPLGHIDEDEDNVCDRCDAEVKAEEPPHVHAHEAVVTAPTCETAGYTTYTCECGDTYTGDEVAALGHNYVESIDKNATCSEAGSKSYECSVCFDSYDEEIPATGEHDYDHVVTAPTCTAAGYTTHTCAFCDYSYTDTEVEATGHTLADVEGKDATCAVAGYTAHKACDCGYTEGKETIPATGEHTDADGNYKCDACSTKMLPADGTTLTVEQALAVAQIGGSAYTTQKYYITGIVSGLYNTQYGNFYIKNPETGKEICIYGLYSADGTTRYDAMSYKPVNGDEITVYTVLGTYNSTAQGKNAWLDDVVAHEHNYTAAVTKPGCLTAGYTTHTCSICGGSYTDSEVAALGHTTENGECENCGQTIGGDAPVVGTLAEFTFGANGAATHVDPNNKFSGTKTYTVNGYSLAITNPTNVYDGGYDAKGNSCIKLGTSSKVGSFSFTVPENVTEVIIYVAQYKANTTKITVNGTAYTITTASNNGAYTAIKIDTTTTKTINFATVSGGVRCMIDTIVFNGTAN